MGAEDAALRDRMAVEDLLIRYARAVDARDFELVATCFTADARAQYAGRTLDPGVEGILSYQRQRVVRFRASMHAVCNVSVDLKGDSAASQCYAVAYLVMQDGGDEVVRMRGITYSDTLLHGPRGWRIADRVHREVWMAQLPSVPPSLHGQPPR